jgi:ATP/maltotriose-dependent transcriptional regulator MalT
VTARDLVLVTAPAGFGKTTLLADWARHTERQVGWLSIDAHDNDPARFWRYLTAALPAPHPTSDRLAALLAGLTLPPVETIVDPAAAEHAQRVIDVAGDVGRPADDGDGGTGGTGGRVLLAEPLTPRELEVLDLLAAGSRNREIAEKLVVSTDTVKKHVSHLLRKLSATNRTEAVARASQLGLVP